MLSYEVASPLMVDNFRHQEVIIDQPCPDIETETSVNNDLLFLDSKTVFYFNLIRKYKKYLGDMEAPNVCSGGLQQFLNKQTDKQKRDDSYVQKQSKFECLPVDVRLHIFSYLTATDLCRVSHVCRSWYDITEDNLLWQGLLERDVGTWNVIGHNTNPEIYKEVGSDWTNKAIYLRCSPVVNKMMYEQNTMFHNISNMLRYFLPKKTPSFTMFGPGLETKTRFIARKIMSTPTLFEILQMVPGRFGGVGSGFKMKCGSTQFILSLLYSATRKEREQENFNRAQQNHLLKAQQDQDGSTEFELNPAVRDFCQTLDGFIYVVDASADAPAVESSLDELQAMVSERWSATYVPVLVVSLTTTASASRLPCCEVVRRLQLSQFNRPWQVRDCVADTLEGLAEGFSWLVEQSQRK